jgi:hypothetical protein
MNEYLTCTKCPSCVAKGNDFRMAKPGRRSCVCLEPGCQRWLNRDSVGAHDPANIGRAWLDKLERAQASYLQQICCADGRVSFTMVHRLCAMIHELVHVHCSTALVPRGMPLNFEIDPYLTMRSLIDQGKFRDTSRNAQKSPFFFPLSSPSIPSFPPLFLFSPFALLFPRSSALSSHLLTAFYRDSPLQSSLVQHTRSLYNQWTLGIEW